MASNIQDHSSSESSQSRETILDFFKKLFRNFLLYISRYVLPNARYLTSDRQESTDNQLERAVKERGRILKDLTGTPKEISARHANSFSKEQRIPLVYYINNKRSILIILQGDITKTKVDAIVNAANEHMTGGSGVDGIIHHAAGNELYKACKAHKQIYSGVRLPTGHSRILLSYDMSPIPYYIINTAGPVYNRRAAKECAENLYSCYKTALALADLYDLESIGFTAISCGIFGYPADDGAEVALRAVNDNARSVPVVVFVLWDNHIYDAWKQKVIELGFIPFDPASPAILKSSQSVDDDQQEKTTPNPTAKENQRQSSTEFNPPVIDLSTSDERKKNPEVNAEDLFSRPPSVPMDTSDTQRTEDMEEEKKNEEDKSTDGKPPLTGQNTVEMATINPEKEVSTTNTDSKLSHSTEEANPPNDDTAKTETTTNDFESPLVADTSGDTKRKLTD